MKRAELLVAIALLPLDYAMVFFAGLTAYSLRFNNAVTAHQPIVSTIPKADYLTWLALASAAVLIVFALCGMYTIRSNRRLVEEVRRVFVGCSLSVLGLMILFFFDRDFFSSRFIVLASYAFALLFVTSMRVAVIYVERSLFARGIGVHHVALVGQSRVTELIAQEIDQKSSLGYAVQLRADRWDDRVQQHIIDLHDQGKLDEVLHTDPDVDKTIIESMHEFCRQHHLIFKYAAALFDTQITTDISIQPIAGIPIIELRKTKLEGWWRVGKRLFDILGAMFLLLCTSPILALAALAIVIDTGFPILFSRRDDGSVVRRVGQQGRLFRYFKLRTMIQHSDSLRYDPSLQQRNIRKDSPLVKIVDDPRITRVGKWLRRFSIDELPEFFLVLKGDMSLVGPRPHLPEEVAKYKEHHKPILYMKPGITGLAQISGRSDLQFEDEVRLDIFYMEHWSLWLDVIILVKTPFILLKRRKAL